MTFIPKDRRRSMRPSLLLLVIAVSVGAAGYLELRHQAERETWRAELSGMRGDLERAEDLAARRGRVLTDIQRDQWRRQEASAELAGLKADILDAAVELAQLESNRSVAADRADTALDDLKKQISALTTIEMDLTTLNKQRHRLERDVELVQERLVESEMGAAERQEHAERLDRQIAALAVQREVLQAKLEAAEKASIETAKLEVAEEAAPPEASPSLPKPTPIPAVASVARADEEPLEERDRARGLYQFGSLSAAPEAVDASEAGALPSLEAPKKDAAEDWAEDQYLLGLSLLSAAEQNSGTRELNDAILAFKAVLGEWPKERDRIRWAIARSDLGYALALLGKRQGRVGVLDAAVVASRDALGEFEKSKMPLLWAAAQHHLGVSLSGLADVQKDQDLRQASIEALERALATFKGAGAEEDVRKIAKRLREASAGLAGE